MELTDHIPALPKRPAVCQRSFFAFALEKDGKFLVRQRPAGVVNAHLWEFPNVELNANGGEPEEMLKAASANQMVTKGLQHVCRLRHCITRYRISVEVFRGEVEGIEGTKPEGNWHTTAEMMHLPFSSAHKRILQRLADDAKGKPSQHPRALDKFLRQTA